MTQPWMNGGVEDRMMARALALSKERSDLSSRIKTNALLVGGIAPPDIVADIRLRARELDFIADAQETRYRWERQRSC